MNQRNRLEYDKQLKVYQFLYLLFYNLNNKMSEQNRSQGKRNSHRHQVEGITKKQEQISDIKTCDKCMKIFTTQVAYQTHQKTKHGGQKQKEESQQISRQQVSGQQQSQKHQKVEKKPQKKMPFKNRMMQIQQNQLQDNIYAYLGELGQKNVQPISNRSQFILQNQNQRLTGQTNYSLNKVVRTPYQQPIKPSDHIPTQQIQNSPYKDFLNILRSQLVVLQQKVEAQKQLWQLRDPMAPEEQTQDQFSLMDIRKLIINYPKRNIKIRYPHFSIFLLWVARICKPPAFKQFYMIIGTYMANYYAVQQNKKKDDSSYDVWNNYYKNNQKNLQAATNLIICDQKGWRKLVQYFVQWVNLFRAMII